MTLHTQSNLFSVTTHTPPKDAKTVNHRLLTQASFIRQTASGIYSLLPPGYRVYEKIQNIIRQEMNAINAQEILMPTLQPKALWLESGRWETIDPPLFTTQDRHGSELALGPTHEEVMTDLARNVINSHKQLPLAVYQIQTKFRNEQRPSGGLLRLREFCMKDLYSFHATQEDLVIYYERVRKAYHTIFRRCGLDAISIAAESGTIGGAVSHEFAFPAEAGEDTFAQCVACGYAANIERVGEEKQCPECHGQFEFRTCIEGGHIFQLGDKYSKQMNATYTAADGTQQLLQMGCYGIGVNRLLAAVVEASHDDRGIIWPSEVAPYDVHVLSLQGDSDAKRIATEISNSGMSVLHDDRQEISAGEKFTDAELIGVPVQVIVSKRGLANGEIEVRSRKALDKPYMVSKDDTTILLDTVNQVFRS